MEATTSALSAGLLRAEPGELRTEHGLMNLSPEEAQRV
jgi:hypothetical protein